MTINSYAPNSLVRLTASTYNIRGALADPTTIILWVSGPDDTLSQFNPIRDSVGQYHYDYLTATPGGQWYYRYQATGAVVVQSPDTIFNVLFLQF